MPTTPGISPVALLLAAAFWTWLWGGAGLLLAVPMTVCVAVMSKYIPQLEFLQVLLGDEPVLEPHQRLYQHLLAGNRDNAEMLLDEALRTSGSLLEAADRVIVPAIRLLEADFDRRALGGGKRRNVLEHINQWVQERLDLSSTTPVAWFICVAPAHRPDEVVAKLLASALLERGIGAAFTTPDTLEKVPFEADGVATIGAVVVSALPPEAVAPARVVCRSVRSRAKRLPLVVGLWDPENDLEKPRQRLGAAGAGGVVVTFSECVAALEALVPSPEVRQRAENPGPSALLQASRAHARQWISAVAVSASAISGDPFAYIVPAMRAKRSPEMADGGQPRDDAHWLNR